MFEVSALNGIVDGCEPEMNISSIDLTRFCTALIGQHAHKKRFNGSLWLIGHCGKHEDITNTGMIFHSDFDHRKYSGAAGWKEETRYG